MFIRNLCSSFSVSAAPSNNRLEESLWMFRLVFQLLGDAIGRVVGCSQN